MPATKKSLVTPSPPAKNGPLRVEWGDEVWQEDKADGALTVAEGYGISLLVGGGWESFDPGSSFPALLAIVTILHARDTGLSIGEAWIDIGARPMTDVLAAISRGE